MEDRDRGVWVGMDGVCVFGWVWGVWVGEGERVGYEVGRTKTGGEGERWQ